MPFALPIRIGQAIGAASSQFCVPHRCPTHGQVSFAGISPYHGNHNSAAEAAKSAHSISIHIYIYIYILTACLSMCLMCLSTSSPQSDESPVLARSDYRSARAPKIEQLPGPYKMATRLPGCPATLPTYVYCVHLCVFALYTHA